VEAVFRFRAYAGRVDEANSTVADPADVCASLRTDARRNRDRILVAAHEVFAEQGVDAPMAEVARRAGVGIATVSRRFSTRDELTTAVFAERMKDHADAVSVALTDPDAWHGFCGYVETVCRMQADDRGFTDVLTRRFPSSDEFESVRSAAFQDFRTLVRRAKASGRLRRDFSTQDLMMLLMANAGVVAATADEAPHTSRRLVAYFLQACAIDNPPSLPPAPTAAQMMRAMRC
jgi:AcrR family transcriptional regulator